MKTKFVNYMTMMAGGLLTVYLVLPVLSYAQEASETLNVDLFSQWVSSVGVVLFAGLVLFFAALMRSQHNSREMHLDDNAGDEGDD